MESTRNYAFVKAAYDNCQDCIKMMDQKVAVLAAILAVISAATVSFVGDLGLAWDSIPSNYAVMLASVTVLAVVAAAGSLFCAAISLLPRRPSSVPLGKLDDKYKMVGQLFWAESINDRAVHPTLEHYVSAINHASEDLITAEIAYETMKLANILSRKTAWGRWAIGLFVIALPLWTGFMFYYSYVHSLVPIN